MTLTPAQLVVLAPHCDAEVLAPALSAAALDAGINTPLRMAHFLGQLCVESGDFTRFVENLSYSAERLCAVWPGRFPHLVEATPCAHNPEALANKVYGGRMGNVLPGDGFRFRGRGLIQLTGRENYARYAALTGLDLLADPDLAGWPLHAPRIAAAFWTAHRLNDLADRDDIEGITRAINGGQTGLPERKAAVARAKSILGIHQT